MARHRPKRRRGMLERDTHGLDWRTRLRASREYVALVTPHWHQDPLCQRQLAYARALGMPIVFLVVPDTPLPAMQEGEEASPVATPKEAAARIAARMEALDAC